MSPDETFREFLIRQDCYSPVQITGIVAAFRIRGRAYAVALANEIRNARLATGKGHPNSSKLVHQTP